MNRTKFSTIMIKIIKIIISLSAVANSKPNPNPREFTEDDIIRYPLILNPPYPTAFKCFNCENAKDNYDCNMNSEDQYCPEDTHLCMSVHTFDTDLKKQKERLAKRYAKIQQTRSITSNLNSELDQAKKRAYISKNIIYATAKIKNSLSVTKRCARRDECHGLVDQTKCTINPRTGVKQCVHCCDGHICNIDVQKSSRTLTVDADINLLTETIVRFDDRKESSYSYTFETGSHRNELDDERTSEEENAESEEDYQNPYLMHLELLKQQAIDRRNKQLREEQIKNNKKLSAAEKERQLMNLDNPDKFVERIVTRNTKNNSTSSTMTGDTEIINQGNVVVPGIANLSAQTQGASGSSESFSNSIAILLISVLFHAVFC